MVLDGGVADISRTRTIAAPPQAIWDVLADFGSLSSWAARADHSCILNQGPDGGAIDTTRRVQVGRNTVVERIIEFEPPSAIAYAITGLPKQFRHVVNRWTLASSGSATEVTLTSRLEFGSTPVARAAGWVVCRGMAKQSDSLLAALANRMEHAHG
ncbi:MULTISPECIES: SRPBCC family protein [unclassified Mycobacterium]|uniref:SRPBCC family protein n=1 Tax=unclassified Mycobacterium TaxID=2642494 RepID=UPI0029C7B2F3|nr:MULTISPECIES: SRPBCC family protein [unclassified Mycobacterium]